MEKTGNRKSTGAKLLEIDVSSQLRRQGLTELFFESAEPRFDELPPEQFFKRFPEGLYEIEGKTLDGNEMQSVAYISHVMPEPPTLYVSGFNTPDDCDNDPMPVVSNPITISWDPVIASHPMLGKQGDIVVERYQLLIEREEPTALEFSVDLPADVTSMVLPEAVISAL